MSKLTITEAVKIIPVSESTLRRDLKSGKVSFETDAKGRKQIGVSELERVYGQLKNNETTAEASGEQAERVNDNHQNLPMNGNDREVIALLENQIQDLKAQLTQASDRENTLVGEKSKLLDMLSAEQEKTRVLMLPAPKKNASWWGYFRLKR